MSEEARVPQEPGSPVSRGGGGGGGSMGWVVGLLAVIAAVALIMNSIAEQAAQQDKNAGQGAPPFALRTLGGGSVSLAQHKGKVVVLDFWATWCAPCVEEMPHLVKVVKELEPDVAFVAINQDDPGSDSVVERFASKTTPGLTPYVAFADDEVVANYGISQLPTMVIIDREGKIAQTYTGFADESTLRKRITRVMER